MLVKNYAITWLLLVKSFNTVGFKIQFKDLKKSNECIFGTLTFYSVLLIFVRFAYPMKLASIQNINHGFIYDAD